VSANICATAARASPSACARYSGRGFQRRRPEVVFHLPAPGGERIHRPAAREQRALVEVAAHDQRHRMQAAGLEGGTLVLGQQPAVADRPQHAWRGQAAHGGIEQRSVFQQLAGRQCAQLRDVAARRRPACSASGSVASGRPAPGLCRIARSKAPWACGEASSSDSEAEPADTPKAVMRVGSPPKVSMSRAPRRARRAGQQP
jgi:hypothetical protein